MASPSGRDQDEDERSCDHAQDGGHLVGQGAPSQDTRAQASLSLLHLEGGAGQPRLLWAPGSSSGLVSAQPS